MDSEFINVYISKQKTWIEDLVAKHVILETRLQIAEQKLVDQSTEIEILKKDVEDKTAFINRLVEANAAKEAEKNPHPGIDIARKRVRKPEHINIAVQEEVNDF